MPTRRALLALSLLLGVALGAPACAAGSLVDLQVIDRSQGHVLPPYRHHGMDYVAGQPGNRYAVRLTNRTDARVLVVLSVDGINAISGETAAVGQTGYVLAPYAGAEITGWRKNYAEAAAFYFTALADSYAARTDRPDNAGVIGVAVYRERVPRPESRGLNAAPPIASRDAAPADRMAAQSAGRDTLPSLRAQAESRLGTGHGEREYSPIAQTAFERATSQPAEVVRVRYDSYSNLVAMGVIGTRSPAYEPEPFARFAPDPR